MSLYPNIIARFLHRASAGRRKKLDDAFLKEMPENKGFNEKSVTYTAVCATAILAAARRAPRGIRTLFGARLCPQDQPQQRPCIRRD